MPKRQTNRKVKITLVSRVPDDPLVLLRAVEDAFRPREIEITVEVAASTHASTTEPDEQLETAAKAHAAEVLDEQERRVKESPPESARADHISKQRGRVRAWLATKIAAGWNIFVKVLPIVERVAKVVKDFV